MGLAGAIRRLPGDQRGASAIEFAIIAPVLLMLIFSILESGWVMIQSVMLDRGVRLATRALQVGSSGELSYDNLKANICSGAAILSDCEHSLRIEFTPINGAGDFPNDATSCVDRSIKVDPVTSYDAGARSQIVFARACLVVDPLMPGVGLGLNLPRDNTGGLRLIAHFAFINEPG